MQENRPIPLFDDILSLNNDNLAEKWLKWLNDYEIFSETQGNLEQGDKLLISSLLFYAGPNLTSIYDEYCHSDDNYEMVKDKILNHFDPIINTKNSYLTISKDSNETEAIIINNKNNSNNKTRLSKAIPTTITKEESSKQVTKTNNITQKKNYFFE
jgi:hypothetical protein